MIECPLCKSKDIILFLNLGKLPLVNTIEDHLDVFDMNLYHCSACANVFSNTPKKPEEIFSEYTYLSSSSSDWLTYCRELVLETIESGIVGISSRIVEIASNDGYLLLNYLDMGYSNILGIEPSKNAASIASSKGIPTVNDFFTSSLADVLAEKGCADLVLALNVLAHVPDINDFVTGIKKLLAPSGVAVIQFHYMPDLIRQRQFDTIYHEHFSYLCLNSVEKLLFNTGLRAYRAVKTPSQGGSLKLYVTHDNLVCQKLFPEDSSLGAIRAEETDFGVLSHTVFMGFSQQLCKTTAYYRQFLNNIHNSGNLILGYGAAAKAVLFCNFLGIDKHLIQCIADINKIKQGRLLPGTDIPIVSPDKLLELNPDYILIFPWNLKDEISMNLRYYKKYKGKFIVFNPDPLVF